MKKSWSPALILHTLYQMENHQDIQFARELVMQHGWNTMAYQILNPGISLWFTERRDAVIGYVTTRTHVIAAGSPVAAEERLDDTATEFVRFVSSRQKKVCFFGAQERIAAILSRSAPVSAILLGAQPVWKPEELLRTIRSKRSLRAQIHRAINKSVSVDFWNAQSSIPIQSLQICLREWIGARPLPPMHFLVEPDTLGRLDDRIVLIARNDDRVIAFCIASPIPLRKGWLIEQIVRGNNAPNGTAELLLLAMAAHLHEYGAALLTLGLSPLSRYIGMTATNPLWLRPLLRMIRWIGSSFYNFEGLDAFKAKFHPAEWEPVYAVTNEASPSFSTLYATAEAFAGSSLVRFVGHACMRAMFRF